MRGAPSWRLAGPAWDASADSVRGTGRPLRPAPADGRFSDDPLRALGRAMRSPGRSEPARFLPSAASDAGPGLGR
jgi:hypothetical protein